MVRKGQGRHPELARPVGKLVDPACPVQEAIVGVDVQVDEILVGRGHRGLTKIRPWDAQAGTAAGDPKASLVVGQFGAKAVTRWAAYEMGLGNLPN